MNDQKPASKLVFLLILTPAEHDLLALIMQNSHCPMPLVDVGAALGAKIRSARPQELKIVTPDPPEGESETLSPDGEEKPPGPPDPPVPPRLKVG